MCMCVHRYLYTYVSIYYWYCIFHPARHVTARGGRAPSGRSACFKSRSLARCQSVPATRAWPAEDDDTTAESPPPSTQHYCDLPMNPPLSPPVLPPHRPPCSRKSRTSAGQTDCARVRRPLSLPERCKPPPRMRSTHAPSRMPAAC